MTPQFRFPHTRTMTSSGDFRVVGVKIVVDPSPDAFAALRRAYSIIHAVPASPRTYSEVWLRDALAFAEGWDLLRRLLRSRPVSSPPVQVAIRCLLDTSTLPGPSTAFRG